MIVFTEHTTYSVFFENTWRASPPQLLVTFTTLTALGWYFLILLCFGVRRHDLHPWKADWLIEFLEKKKEKRWRMDEFVHAMIIVFKRTLTDQISF